MISGLTYEKIKSHILLKLGSGLPKDLMYHGLHHTLDVLEQAERIAVQENITDANEMILLKVACLYHDSGFLTTYFGHEEVGCDLVRKELPDFHFTNEQIEIVCGIIMATRIPQTPLTKLEKIICDADLDYLGRLDFFSISHSLFDEMMKRGYVNNENDWDLIQVEFIKAHSYFTENSIHLREEQKNKHLKILEDKLETFL